MEVLTESKNPLYKPLAVTAEEEHNLERKINEAEK